jgi:ABC-2 type transport system ATP-binding protein
MIKVDHLTKRFDGTVAVHGLSLEVARGEIFGLLGPNGAGKTTTVRMLSCLISPSEGSATVAGYDIAHDGPKIRQIVGLLTESPGLYEKLDARANLAFYAGLYELDDIPQRVERYLRLVGLWGRHEEPVAQFSKGMKQRLAIARSLVHEPQVLFLDEPTAGLDPQAAKSIRESIQELRSEGRTILLCTHNLTEAEQLCDRIAVLKTKIIALDTPENLRRSLFGRRTEVRLREVVAGVVEAIAGLEFVSDVSQEGQRLLISLGDPDVENPIIVRKLVEMGADVQAVSEQSHSLEETYLSLIGGDGADAGGVA